MNAIYILLFVTPKLINAKYVNNYTPEKVIERLTRFDETFEKKIEIRNRNRYNEIFTIKYKVLNETGHKEVHSIIKNYLNAYFCFCNKNDFS
ncbi:hypothetical protein COBT_002250, partial [Conglomerata obtusa]